MTRRLLILMVLLILSSTAHAQSNCSTGGWNYYDYQASNPCPTNPSNGYVINITDTRTADLSCQTTGFPSTQYWTGTSQDVGYGERYCPIAGMGNVDCWPRMVFYEVDGGQPYPPPSYQISDVYYNRFFNQGYDHKVDVVTSKCYEVPPQGQFSSQDFKQCTSRLCGGPGSPIILDIDGHGFDLTDAKDGVMFDLSGSGQAIQMSWTATGSTNAFLALPVGGVIHNGKELFGNFTPQPASVNPNGFAALAVYDQPANGGNGDGVIDAKDSIFSSLRLWIDRNHDGVSQPNELFTLSQLGITSISLNYKWDQRRDQYGNVFRYRAQVGSTDGAGRIAYDVFLVTDTPTATLKGCPVPKAVTVKAGK